MTCGNPAQADVLMACLNIPSLRRKDCDKLFKNISVRGYRAVYKHLAPMMLGNSKYNTVSNTTMHPTINDYPAEQMHPAFFFVITDLVNNVK